MPNRAEEGRTFWRANLLFLISIVLVLTLGSAVQVWHLWKGLILTELFLILLPALIAAHATGATAAALRLRWVGAGPCWLGVAIGAGLFPAAAGAGWVASKALGYNLDFFERYLPKNVPDALIFFAAMAIAGPVCEELLFRGYILWAYERRGLRPWTTVLTVAGLFTAWHLSPLRAPGVAIAALAVTYVAWRTGSVWPSIAVHFGANATAAMAGIAHQFAYPMPSGRVALVVGTFGGALAALCLWGIARTATRETPAAIPAPAGTGGWWPLYIAGPIVILAMGSEWVLVRMHPDIPAEAEMRRATVVDAYWNDALPDVFPAPRADMEEYDFYLRIREGRLPHSEQWRDFVRRAEKDCVLSATGRPEIRAVWDGGSRNAWHKQAGAIVYDYVLLGLRIDERDRARVAAGVRYRVTPVERRTVWTITEGVAVEPSVDWHGEAKPGVRPTSGPSPF